MLAAPAHRPQAATPTFVCQGILRSPICYTPSEGNSITIGDNVWAPVTISFHGSLFSGHVLIHHGDSELGRELGSVTRLGVPVLLGDAVCKATGADGSFCQWSRLILVRRKHVESAAITTTLLHEAEHARAFVGAERGSLKALTELSYIKRQRFPYGEFVVNEIQAHLDELTFAFHRGGYPRSILEKIAHFGSDLYQCHAVIRSFLSSISKVVAYLEPFENKHALASALSREVRVGDMFFPTVEITLPGSDTYACCIALPKNAAQLEPGSPELTEIILERMEAFLHRIQEQSNLVKRSLSPWGIPKSACVFRS